LTDLGLLDVRDLHVHLPTPSGIARAVDGVSFSIQPRQIVVLVGESGCGKSATALALVRLHRSTTQVTGQVRFEGQSLLDLPVRLMAGIRGRRMAMIFQEPSASLNPIYSLGSQVAEAVRVLQGLARRTAWQGALDLFRAVQLQDPERVARQYPHEVSGGMQQRVAIALALAGRPRLLLADEPTTALDVMIQAEILSLLRRLCQQLGMGMLLNTHDLAAVADMADTVAVMYAGKIVESGPVDRVLHHSIHPYTAALLACRPRLGQQGRLPSVEGVVPPATHYPTGCRFRERCTFATEKCFKEPGIEESEAGHGAACWHPITRH
jgi:oligopeptide/dipeptide ABC transporter ATP-binding protein